MYDLHLKVCHSVRRRVRHIQSRAVTSCESDMFGITPRWIYIPFSSPSLPQYELRDKLVAPQCSHDARREVNLSLSRSVESIVYPGSCVAFSL